MSGRQSLLSGFSVTSLCTLLSRVLGMLRDMVLAALLGMSGGGVMDAFVAALAVPDTFRRLLAEGALTASYIPELARKLAGGRHSAWQLVTAALISVSAISVALVLLGEVICGAIWYSTDLPQLRLLAGLVAVMLPYVAFVCVTAQLAGTLQALQHFAAPALAPVVVNLCWLVACWLAVTQTPVAIEQAYILAASLWVAGGVQVSLQLGVLQRFGFRFQSGWQQSRSALGRIARAGVPALAGLSVTQLNTLIDRIMAWSVSELGVTGQLHVPADAAGTFISRGAATAVFLGERMYMFPLGLIGIALATVIYPSISRQAARGANRQLGTALTVGLRLGLLLAVPASVGLAVLAEPIVRLLFERGQFQQADTIRTAAMIRAYAGGVWAYCALPLLVRAFYAVGDHRTPLRAGLCIMGLNVVGNVVLSNIWGETGLAHSTAICAILQTVVLTSAFRLRHGRLLWGPMLRTLLRCLSAAALMGVAVYATGKLVPGAETLFSQSAAVAVPALVGMAAYFTLMACLAPSELRGWQRRPHAGDRNRPASHP